MKILENKNSEHPYYIEPKDMDFAFFVFKRKDGSYFRQYERDKNNGKRWIAHHWHEVIMEEIDQFEVWAQYVDQYGEVKQWPAFKIKIQLDWMIPVFRYKNVAVAHATKENGEFKMGKLNLIKRTAIFGIEIPALGHKRLMWEMDHGYNIKSLGNGDY